MSCPYVPLQTQKGNQLLRANGVHRGVLFEIFVDLWIAFQKNSKTIPSDQVNMERTVRIRGQTCYIRAFLFQTSTKMQFDAFKPELNPSSFWGQKPKCSHVSFKLSLHVQIKQIFHMQIPKKFYATDLPPLRRRPLGWVLSPRFPSLFMHAAGEQLKQPGHTRFLVHLDSDLRKWRRFQGSGETLWICFQMTGLESFRNASTSSIKSFSRLTCSQRNTCNLPPGGTHPHPLRHSLEPSRWHLQVAKYVDGQNKTAKTLLKCGDFFTSSFTYQTFKASKLQIHPSERQRPSRLPSFAAQPRWGLSQPLDGRQLLRCLLGWFFLRNGVVP